MTDKLEDIKKRHEGMGAYPTSAVFADIDFLLAEVDKLKEQNQLYLKISNESLKAHDRFMITMGERDREKYRNAKLVEALRKILSAQPHTDTGMSDGKRLITYEEKIAQQALKEYVDD